MTVLQNVIEAPVHVLRVPKVEHGLWIHLRARDDEREQIEALAVP